MAQNTSARVEKHRQSLRKAGLRPIQIWVADTRRKGFKSACHRQSRLIQNDALENDTLNWIEAASDDKGWV